MGYFSTKEHIGMSFVGLVEPDIALRAAKLQTMVASDFNLKRYNEIYWNWKHNYRSRYSERKLEQFGYEPYSSGKNVEENLVGMTAYMQGIDSSYHHTINFNTGIANLYTQLVSYMQNNGYNYSIKNRQLLRDGGDYRYSHTTYLEDDDPYTPDDKTVIVGHFWDYDRYGEHFADSENAEFYTVSVPNIFGKEDTFENTYTRDELDTEYYIYLKFRDQVPADIYELKEFTLTPLIMLKEYGLIAENTDDHRRMMREIGVSPRDFKETLEEVDDEGEASVDNAYLMNALSTANPYDIEAKYYPAEEAQHLPAAFLDSLSEESFTEYTLGDDDGVLEDLGESIGLIDNTGDDDIQVAVEPTQEDVDKWYNKHLNEQAYLARALFKTFAYYNNSIDLQVLEDERFSLIYIGNSVADTPSEFRGETPTNKYGPYIITDEPWQDSDMNVTVELGGIKMQYACDISIETKEGRVRPDAKDKRAQGNIIYSGRKHGLEYIDDGDKKRDYWETEDSEGYDKLVIQVQKTANTYQEMIITNYRADYDLGSHGFATGFGGPNSENKLILPYFVMKEVKFREYVTVSDHSFMVFAYMYKKVSFDWWQFFKSLVIAIVICVVTAGTGCGVSAVILNWVISTVIYIALQYLLEMLDMEILGQILMWAYQAYQMMQGDFNLADMPAENYLKLATQVSSMAMNAKDVLSVKIMAEDEAEIKANQKVQDKIDNIDNAISYHPNAIMTAHQSFDASNSPEVFYQQMYGGMLFDFNQFYDVDNEIEKRKQVVPG